MFLSVNACVPQRELYESLEVVQDDFLKRMQDIQLKLIRPWMN